MTKLVFAAVALSVAAPAFASTPLTFERDGISYVGSVQDRNGIRYISGREVQSNRTFSLRVAKGWVTGDYAGDAVSYAVPVQTAATH